ncbi:ABC transporter ATP-binding protein [Lolliginicoccus suaedae]|uniref:ABC transporter ATP-binding protein n=1 Tax=Lolliginicoccus suaedae TaxID=2605429 RepID=UPI0011ED7110|nr:ABC transporter ATP-binding protein [Lolliginicoccus suaedae]
MHEQCGRSALAADAVTIGYGDADVVSAASLTLSTGAVVALVGPNGSGKSTLLRGLARLQRLRAGTVTLDDDRDAARLSSKEFARQLTMLAQSRPTPSGMTVRDAVEFGRHPHRTGWRGRDKDGPRRIEEALALTGMTTNADVLVDELSGGQLQRAWFASALAQDTKVLLLDEPTNHLDLRYQAEILELLRALADNHGVAIGVVLHDLNHAATLADRVAVLSRGTIVAEGPPAEVFTSTLLSEVYEIEVTVDRPGHDHAPVINVPRMQLRQQQPASIGSRS